MPSARNDIVVRSRDLTFRDIHFIGIHVLQFLRTLQFDIEMDGWDNEIDMLLDVFRNTVVLACYMSLPACLVLPFVVFGIHQGLGLGYTDIRMEPVETLGLLDAVAGDSVFCQPFENSCNRFIRWSECFGNLLGSPMLSVVRRFWMRDIIDEFLCSVQVLLH